MIYEGVASYNVFMMLIYAQPIKYQFNVIQIETYKIQYHKVELMKKGKVFRIDNNVNENVNHVLKLNYRPKTNSSQNTLKGRYEYKSHPHEHYQYIAVQYTIHCSSQVQVNGERMNEQISPRTHEA